MLKNLRLNSGLALCLFVNSSCATSIKWDGKLDRHARNYMESFEDFREKICVSTTEADFDRLIKAYRGQGYWIPELNNDVDVEAIKAQLPELEKKLLWITKQITDLDQGKLPKVSITDSSRDLLKRLLALKKAEIEDNDAEKVKARQESLKLLEQLQKEYARLIRELPYFTNYNFPVDHLKNRKVHDLVREKEDEKSVHESNKAFLYRKIQEDGTFLKDRTGPDIYFRSTLDTLHFELLEHDFWLTEDARYDLDFVLGKIESELGKGKDRILERLNEWRERTEKTLAFYRSLTLPENRESNRKLIAEHNIATVELKKFVYSKQAQVYKFWLNRSEINRAIFALETILMNEVGGVDGDDALERMDVARVVMNRLDKPKYLVIGKKEFIMPYLREAGLEENAKTERWLNALFKQGEFSFTYYYMHGVSKIFCPDMASGARKLRKQNVEIALQALKDEPGEFKATRYFSRASMIGRIHMDSIWDDYKPYPERPGLLAQGQEGLSKAMSERKYTYLYSFKDPKDEWYQVVEINNKIYALSDKSGSKIFYFYRNPHFFRYFTKAPH